MSSEIDGGRNRDAQTVRAEAQAARTEIARATADIKGQQAALRADLNRRRDEMEAEYRKARQDLEEMMAPLQKQLAQLTEVAWSTDLYLGRGEELMEIRGGKPAPRDTPIAIRQKVLSMAEESLVLLDKQPRGMDAKDVGAFVDWLTAAPENLDRVLPEQKGVIVLVPTWVASDAENPWEAASKDLANRESWWLLRNGERLHMLVVDPKLQVGKRLLPNRTEFTDVFTQKVFGRSKPPEPGSDEWARLEEHANARRRHYMRIMMVLQGIVDRTTVWHPLPEFGVNLMSVRAQLDGKVTIIQDADTSIQLGDGHESFKDWQQRLNRQLRPGLRVIGDWTADGFRRMRDVETWDHPRVYPTRLDARPEAGVPHLIEDRRDGGLVIRFDRGEVRARNVPVPGKPGYHYTRPHPRPAKQRASLVVMPEDKWVLPFDLLTLADLRYFLASREERSKHFLDMVPMLRSALAAREAEAALEAPFRALLAQLLITEGADPDRADDLVDDLVTWWKSANLWARPLNGEPEHEAKAAREIVAEYTRRASTARGEDTAVAAGRAVPGVICVAATRKGDWYAYSPSTPAHDPGVFLDITPIRKDGTLGTVKSWQRVQQRSATALHVAWSAPEWATWKFAANPDHYLTSPEREQAVAEIIDGVHLPICVTEYHDPADPGHREMGVYFWADGTPEITAPTATDDPYSWQAKPALIGVTYYRITKRHGDVTLTRTAGSENLSSIYSPYIDGPWWPDDVNYHYGSNEVGPRLAWSDPHMVTRVATYRDGCKALRAAEKAENRRIEAEGYRYSRPVEALVEAEWEKAVRAEFELDFGTGADDLWPAHLETQRNNRRGDVVPHPRELWELTATAVKHNHPVVGQTLAALDAFADRAYSMMPRDDWGRPPSRRHKCRCLDKYDHIVVPEPPAEDDLED